MNASLDGPLHKKSPRLKGPQKKGRFLVSGASVVLLASIFAGVPSSGAQSVDSLKKKAEQIAAEIDSLDQKTNTLDEAFNQASEELEALKSQLGTNKSRVDEARTTLDQNRAKARDYVVAAFIGENQDDVFAGLTGDLQEDSHRRVFLDAGHGDREQVIEDMTAAQKTLAAEEASLQAAKAKVDAKTAAIEASQRDLEATIKQRKELFESVKGDLAKALAEEQARRAAALAAQAKAEAEAAARRAAAARRTQAVTLVASPAGSGTSGTATVAVAAAAAPRSVSISPPPSDAPTAVRVALEQQGDPYVWAASGPNSFDCSGLILFAYRAAGISLPHSSRSLRAMTKSISADELQPGDLVFGGSPVHHVGMYIGNGQMVHAPHSGDVVKVTSIYGTSKPVSFGRL
jgi:cell wall-associated NlpC family hydrolase